MNRTSPARPLAEDQNPRSADPSSYRLAPHFQLTTLESALPRWLPKYKQFRPISLLFATLTGIRNLYHSKDFKVLSFDTLSRRSPVTLLECALTENRGERGTPPFPPASRRNSFIVNKITDSSPTCKNVSNEPNHSAHRDPALVSYTSSTSLTSSPTQRAPEPRVTDHGSRITIPRLLSFASFSSYTSSTSSPTQRAFRPRVTGHGTRVTSPRCFL
jgi:hypothetical protein